MDATDTLSACNAFAAKLSLWRGGMGIEARTLQVIVRHVDAGLELAAIWQGETLFAMSVDDPHATPEQLHALVGLALAREHLEVPT